MARANWPRIEARYYQVDLLDVSFRRFLNLVLAWVQDNVDHQTWKKDWKRDFQFEPNVQQHVGRRLENIRPASGDKRATISFPTKRALTPEEYAKQRRERQSAESVES